MGGVIQFIRNLVLLAVILATAGTLIEATGLVGREAIKAHQHDGISFRWLNRKLQTGR